MGLALPRPLGVAEQSTKWSFTCGGYFLAGEALSAWSLGCSAVVVLGVLLVVSK